MKNAQEIRDLAESNIQEAIAYIRENGVKQDWYACSYQTPVITLTEDIDGKEFKVEFGIVYTSKPKQAHKVILESYGRNHVQGERIYGDN